MLPGGKDDALWYAMGANKAHGLPMKRGDVKRAVELAVKTWPNKSQQEIAEQVGCAVSYVNGIKKDKFSSEISPPTRTDSIGRTRPTSYATRKPVELAVKEFGGMTNEVIAKMCGVDPKTVADTSASSGISRPEKRTGSDGKQYPATRATRKPTTPEEEEARTYGDVRRRQPRRRDGVRGGGGCTAAGGGARRGRVSAPDYAPANIKVRMV